MSTLSVVRIFGDISFCKSFCLNQKTSNVEDNEFGKDELKQIINSLFDTMYDYPNGVGLAANQVGIMKRICVLDLRRDGKQPLLLINPEYIPETDEIAISNEQCISFPDISVSLQRYKRIKVSYQDFFGDNKTLEAVDFKSFAIQHEIDHLNGVSFIDRNGEIGNYIKYSSKLANKAVEVILNEKRETE